MSWPASSATSAVESCKRALSEQLENATSDQTSREFKVSQNFSSGRRRAWGSSSVLVTIGMLTIGITAGYFSYSGLKTVDDRGDSPRDEALNLPEASVLLNQSSTEVFVEEAELVDERAEVFVERSTADIVQGAQASVQPSLPASPGAVSRGDRTMTPGLGWVLVRTTPPGASVTLGGVDRGLTPLALRDIPYGRYHVEVGHVGYRTHSENVTLSIDSKVAAIGIGLRSIEEGVPATQAVCSIAVESRPPGARVDRV